VTRYRTKRARAAVLLAVAGLLVAACGGSKVNAGSTAGGGGGNTKPCGTVNIAVNPWVGYEADSAVVGYLLKNKLGCTVVNKNLNEQVSWQGFDSGAVDVILENWGHEDLAALYIGQKKVATDFGSQGNQGVIGWFVPKWMSDKYPDITDYKNLNKYASMFKTSESGSQGQLLDGDPSYVTNDAALVKNLGLNFKVVYSGSEAAEIKALQTATTQKTPLLFYFYTPQWALNDLPVTHVTLPPYTTGCDKDPKKVACDYPPYHLNKVVRTAWATSGSPSVAFVKAFSWTNEDQNSVAESIAKDGLSDDAAAQKWVDANQAKWQPWVDAAKSGASPASS
jgi:glycine betaine/proline transport system substrate-binding protein